MFYHVLNVCYSIVFNVIIKISSLLMSLKTRHDIYRTVCVYERYRALLVPIVAVAQDGGASASERHMDDVNSAFCQSWATTTASFITNIQRKIIYRHFPRNNNTIIVTSAERRRICFHLFRFVCLFCLCACGHNWKARERIFMKFSG